MPSLSESIITNIGNSYIETYLRQKGLVKTEDEKSLDLKYWVDNLLKAKKMDIEEFEDFLFDELFWGKRKTIRVYKLESTKNYKYPADWEFFLSEKYGLDSIEFCNILNTIPNEEDEKKIVAVRSEENNSGDLVKIRILFVFYIEVREDGRYKGSSAYVPVEIDFREKLMLIKAWTRQHVEYPDYKAENLIQRVKNLMEFVFKVVTQPYRMEHKKALFKMSKNLIYEAYSNIPAYNKIGNMESFVKEFMRKTYENLSLRNVVENDNKEYVLSKEVLDFESEVKNVLESLVISDHFFDRSYEEIWKMGLEAIVSRIKFNDKEKVLTSLSSENTEAPIFCTKTFMSLKNRMEETERIETLWIAMDREKRKQGHLNVKFDASNQEFLGILITYGIRFNEADMNLALRIYEKYDENSIEKIAGRDKKAVGQ